MCVRGGASRYAFMQSGPHTAIHVAARPEQFMKLVVSILPSNGNSVWLYVLSLLLSRIWSNFAHTLADVSSPPATSGTQNLPPILILCVWFKWIGFCPHSGKFSFFRLGDYCPYFLQNFCFPTPVSWILYSALFSLPSSLVLHQLD